MAWKKVTTKLEHPCWICRKPIPAGTTCLSRSQPDSYGQWTTKYMCPLMSCFYTAGDRQALLGQLVKQMTLL